MRELVIQAIQKVITDEKHFILYGWKDVNFAPTDGSAVHVSKVEYEKLSDSDLLRYYTYLLLMRADITTMRVNKQYFGE
jgi:hypothetical protein